jgi:hypothetical protein
MVFVSKLIPHRTQIFLERSHEQVTFWSQHREHFWRAFYAGIASLITGLTVYWLTKK